VSEWIDYFKKLTKDKAKNTVFHDDYLAFWDTETNPEEPKLKAFMGLVYDPTIDATVPGIVLGAGDGEGNNRAYIEKDDEGLKIIYRVSEELASGIWMDTSGNVHINDAVIPPLTDLVLMQNYIDDSDLWNDKLAGLTYDADDDYYYVGFGKLSDDVADEINSKIDGSYPKFTHITSTGVYTGTVVANQVVTAGLYAERIYSPSNSQNYAKVGGNYADMSLYHYGYTYPWFSIYDAGPPGPAGSMKLTDSGGNVTWLMSFDSSGVRPNGTWDCYYAEFDRMYNSDGYQYVTNDQHTTNRYLEVLPNSHNHGITSGTKLAVVNDQLQITGYVAFSSTTLSISPDQHNHFIADY